MELEATQGQRHQHLGGCAEASELHSSRRETCSPAGFLQSEATMSFVKCVPGSQPRGVLNECDFLCSVPSGCISYFPNY